MKTKILLLASVILSLDASAQVFIQTMLRLPDTGQTASYSFTFGEDNDYTIHAPSFLLNGNGTVTDTVTSLMWQQSDGGELTVENAIAYCDSLSLGGFTNWRLPNAHEAFSILNHQHSNPAMDPAFFTPTNAEYWWTNDRQSNDTTKIWVTNAGGGIGNHPKAETISAGGTKKFHVKAVRDVAAPLSISAHYTDNGDSTITDHATNLMWLTFPVSGSLTWENAIAYSENLILASYTDWRLPNIKELQSLNDESVVSPSVNATYFGALGIKKFWSSTTLPNQTSKAWYWDNQVGIVTYDLKTNVNSVLCVRSIQSIATAASNMFNEHRIPSVYPNPFTNRIYVSNGDDIKQVQLSDCFGRILYKGLHSETHDFSALPSGLYFLRISGKSIFTIKLIKE